MSLGAHPGQLKPSEIQTFVVLSCHLPGAAVQHPGETRIRPDIPRRPGRDTRREFEYERHGTVCIIAAMNVATGEVISQRIARNESVTFMKFLAKLDQHIARPCASA